MANEAKILIIKKSIIKCKSILNYMIRPYFLFSISKCIFIIHLFLFFFSLSIFANYNGLITPKGFKADLYISDISAPRQMVEGNKFIFIGGIKGEIYAINKKNTEIRYMLASDLNTPYFLQYQPYLRLVALLCFPWQHHPTL